MHQPPRIAYLCLQATREGQASYVHVHEIIRGLERRDMNVALFEPYYADRKHKLPGALGRLLEFGRVQRRLRALLRDVDAVYIRAHFAALPTALHARRMGLPVIQEVNGSYSDLYLAWPFTRHLRWLFVPMMRWQYRHADALVTVTEDLAEWLADETGRSDVEVIPNGANTELFRPGATTGIKLPERYVAFVGALAPWQGVETMLRATKEPEWPEGLSLVIAGHGQLYESVRHASEESDRVVYLGVVPYADVPGVLSGSLIGLSPQEEFGGRTGGVSPIKMYETLSCGVPIIVTALPGSSEFVSTHSCGLVVPPEDPRALAHAVAQLVDDPATRRQMGERGRATVMAEASWDARAEATAAVIGRQIKPTPR